MALATLLTAIEEKGRAEADRIVSEAVADAAATKAAAEVEASRHRETLIEAMKPALEREKARRLNAASRVGLEESGRVRKRLLDDVGSEARLMLATTREGDSYAAILKSLGEEALALVATPDPVVEVDPKDEGLAKQLWPRLAVESSLKSAGGARVRSRDSLIACDNTLEARLRRVIDEQPAMAALFN